MTSNNLQCEMYFHDKLKNVSFFSEERFGIARSTFKI